MVISFEEKDRSAIEASGITIIEFKQRLYNMGKTVDEAWKALKEIADKAIKALNVFYEKIIEVVDNVRLVCERVYEAYHYPTSRRYKIAKTFSKCTGTDISFGWKITWRIKRWLARRYC